MLPPTTAGGPDATLAGSDDAVRIEGVLDALVQPAQRAVVVVVAAGDQVHVVDVGAVFAVAFAGSVGNQRAEEAVDLHHHLRIVAVEQHLVDVGYVALAERERAVIVHAEFSIAGIGAPELRQRFVARLRQHRRRAAIAEVLAAADRPQRNALLIGQSDHGLHFFHRQRGMRALVGTEMIEVGVAVLVGAQYPLIPDHTGERAQCGIEGKGGNSGGEHQLHGEALVGFVMAVL